MNTISKQEMMDLIERGVMAILDMRRQFELHGICTTEEFDKEKEKGTLLVVITGNMQNKELNDYGN